MSNNRTPVAANTRSNNPTLVTDTLPLPRQNLMERGGSGETKDNKETKTEDAADPPPPARQAEALSIP